ncbi:MAG TPA: helix-turn-helix domain-containing protein [Candidatus Polarisedimenticolia bacterium]|nr:helix-turn-helix domain-containing protein [Candidatus Polarisedimenticolia bacterium]
MASFGEELKRERELRDISLKEISEATKISLRFLEALEQDNYDILPGGVFNRGFIRAYARFIGIDGEEMVNAYLHEVSQREARHGSTPRPELRAGPAAAPLAAGVFRPEPRGGKKSEPVEPPRERKEIPAERRFLPKARQDAVDGRTSLALWALAVLAFLIGAGVLTMSLVRQRASAGPSSSPSREAGRSAAMPPASPVTLDASAAAITGPGAPQPAAGGLFSDSGQGSSAQDEENAAAQPEAGGSAPAGTAGDGVEAPPGPVQHQVVVQAREATRVRIECGTTLSLDQELWPGQSRSVTCAEPVILSADNAGALQYSVDGNPPALLGLLGERVEGLQVAPPPALPEDVSPRGGTARRDPGALDGRN